MQLKLLLNQQPLRGHVMLKELVMLQQILQSKRLLQPRDPAVPPLGNHSHLCHARHHNFNRD